MFSLPILLNLPDSRSCVDVSVVNVDGIAVGCFDTQPNKGIDISPIIVVIFIHSMGGFDNEAHVREALPQQAEELIPALVWQKPCGIRRACGLKMGFVKHK